MRRFKLSLIKFKEVDINIPDWIPFQAQFKKIHDDTDIGPGDKIEKFIQAFVAGNKVKASSLKFPLNA